MLTKRINLVPLKIPIKIYTTPHPTIHHNKKSLPYFSTIGPCITARAPQAPDIMPGLPPIKAVINPNKKDALRPIIGDTAANKLNAIASGIYAKDIVTPDKISFKFLLNFRCTKDFL